MNSLAAVRAPSEDTLADLVQRLLEVAVPVTLSPVGGGGNNRIFKVDAGDARFALKCYPRQESDPRDRLRAEFGALSFLKQNGVDAVPQPVALDREAGIAVYSWFEGVPVDKPGRGDIEQTIGFLRRLNDLAARPGADRLPLASAACLSPAAVVAQVEMRYLKLRASAFGEPELMAFLDGEFATCFKALVARAREIAAISGVSYSAELPIGRRCLSPSDFGFHNVLRRPDGSLCFVDFEYFGWDDPAKLACDFVLHPGHELTRAQRRDFEVGAQALFGAADPVYEVRRTALLPLFGLCWTLILLNEFLPATSARRAFAKGGDDDDGARRRQLDRARSLLCELRDDYVDCNLAH